MRLKSRELVYLSQLDDSIIEKGFIEMDCMKIDVEGAKFAVLSGTQMVLREHQPVFLLEMLDPKLRNQDSRREALSRLIKSFGYEPYYFHSTSGHPVRSDGQAPSENVQASPPEWVLPDLMR